MGYAVHRNRRGELFRDSTDASPELHKYETKSVELMSMRQTIQNTITAGIDSEVGEQMRRVQDGQPHDINADVPAVDIRGCIVPCENSTVNALHV